MNIIIGYKTDIGKERKVNEDYLGVMNLNDEISIDAVCLAVADGVGGHGAGDVASQSTIKEIGKRLRKSTFWSKKIEIRRNLNNKFKEINQIIYKLKSSKPQYANMCTTLSVAAIYDSTLYLGHVGDSRIYRLRNNVLDQLTMDHTLVQEQINKGTLSEKEALSHPDRSVITRAIGFSDDIEVDTFQAGIDAGDIFIVCSDGLSSLVDEKKIVKTINNNKDPQKSCNKLVDLANRYGGTDNITVIIAKVLDGEPGSKKDEKRIPVFSSIKRIILGKEKQKTPQKQSKRRAPSTIT